MKVKELFSSPSNWTKGTYARDTNGDSCSVRNRRAVCFCLHGAVTYCYGNNFGEEYDNVFNKLQLAIMEKGYASIPGFNDEMGYQAVLELVTKLDI